MARFLDLCCCSGGAAEGIRSLGHTVVGVDVRHWPQYPGPVHAGDAVEAMATLLKGGQLCGFGLNDFAGIWASPPCQGFSCATPIAARAKHRDLITPLRPLLWASGLPFIIENVPGAPLVRSVRLCGAMFGLGVVRHRWFESNVLLFEPAHTSHPSEFVTVVGGGGQSHGRFTGNTAMWKAAMGLDRPRRALVEAVPPAYSRYLVAQL
jgi:DNA (cytosine-5)-methyltransferase 1